METPGGTNQEREAVERAFERFGVRSDHVASTLHEREFDLVLVFVRDDEPGAAAGLVARVFDLAVGSGAEVLSADGSLVVLGTGVLPHETGAPPSGAGRRLAEALADGLGNDAAILYGRFHGLVGAVGVERRMAYTALTPGWKSVVRTASEVAWGHVREWHPQTAGGG